MSTPPVTGPLIPGEPKKRAGLDFRVYLDLKNEGQIVIHPSIVAELALGSLPERSKTLALLDLLPQVRVAQWSEVRRMIEAGRLYSFGIGLTDAHLIASVFIDPSTLLWTRDKRLRKAAESLGIPASLR
jgi:predicted nucleic acid-binding protein